jgi:2-dehydro-3-deoxyphosphogluconate aldolase / (4S)-4-hydroxy-2-oxoglutarate aldolase
MMPEVAARIAAARVLPVLRLPSAKEAADAALRCIAAGVDVVELTATTPEWHDALHQVREAAPDRLIGLGTVLDATTARQALALGADFLVSPCPVPAVRDEVGTRLIEGGMTVGEVLDAGRRGIAKLFPAHVGGVAYLRSLLAIEPSLRVIPTGGIRLADVPDWLDAGAYAVGIGADLLAQPDIAKALAAAVAG